jgi:peptidyl-dipeptidase A
VKHLSVLAIVFAAACGGKKQPDTIQTPPPSGSDENPTANIPTKQEPPPSDNTAKLVEEAKQFAQQMDAELRKLYVDASLTAWANETDITPAHEEAASKALEEQAKGITRLIKQSQRFAPVMDKLDPATRRQFMLLRFSGQPAPDDPAQAAELAKLATEMSSIYGKGKICDPKLQGKRDKAVADLDKKIAAAKSDADKAKLQEARGKAENEGCKDLNALDKILQKSKKPDELLAVWKGWHDNVGHAEKDLFVKYVDIANAGARGIGFKDVAEMWKAGYDMAPEAFEAETDRLYNQLKPLYEQLHCYTRRKLNKKYGDKVVPLTGPIPAHLTGNMWAQTWGWLYKDLEPFPGQPPIDVTPTLEKGGKKYDEKGMVRIGEAFYTSLGFPPLPATFWERSMFQKPPGKEAVCHASAWDVQFNNDVRIKMCIQRTHEELDVIHHELGHDFYFSAYYKLPILFQNGANDGFHEAIGDTVVLSMTPEYLKEKGLLDKVVKNDKITINLQMNKALEKIAFLPWGLLVDKWRWDVFSGKVKPEDYNKHWWDLRLKYQGIAPPIERTSADFDPGAKYHVPANVPYMRYFLAAVLQFQFHRALCKIGGHKGPLHECSIYGNKAAGEAYWRMLSHGASQPWQDTLFELTGSREMDATAILEYFAPLKAWLEEQNKGQKCGW